MFKFAILGGAFNPIHNGHLYIANAVIENNIARKVIFMPNGNHPLKKNQLLLPYEQRFDLIQKAIINNPTFSVSDLDGPNYGISYTYNLILRLQQTYNKQDFTFVIGYDNALNFSQWHKPEWLLDNVNFTVVSRKTGEEQIAHLDKRFSLIEIKAYDISSTQIRKKLDNHEDLSGDIPSQILPLLIAYWKKLKLSSHQ